MEDLRSAKREGPSPSEACQIRRGREKKNSKPLLLGLIRTSTNTRAFCCVCVRLPLCARTNKTGGAASGLCGF